MGCRTPCSNRKVAKCWIKTGHVLVGPVFHGAGMHSVREGAADVSKKKSHLGESMQSKKDVRRVAARVALLVFVITVNSYGAVPRFAYVVNSQDSTVSIYTVNASTGQLRANGYVLVGSKPLGAALAVTASAQFLYVSDFGLNKVSAFVVNRRNGGLTRVTGSPFSAGTGPAATAASQSGKFVYVANHGSGTVSAYTVNSATGVLTPVSGTSTTGTSPVALDVDPSGKFLYVANRGSNNVSAFSIDGTTGALTPVPGSPFPAETSPSALTIASSGEFVYVANSGSNNVSGFALNTANGVLTAISGSPFSAEMKPSAVTVDPATKFAYVTNSGSNNVSEYTINAVTGALSPVAGSPVSAGTAPSGASVDPSGTFVFVSNANSDDVWEYSIGSTGALTALVPGPIRARVGPGALVVSSGAKAVTYAPSLAYAADFEGFTGGVLGLSVNSSTGALTTLATSPFGSSPTRSIAASPNGRFVYTASADGTNTVGEYRVNLSTGALTPLGTIASGNSPYSVTVDPSSRFVYAVGINTNGVYAYSINQLTGVLTLVAGSPFTMDVLSPVGVWVDPTGRFLMVADGCCPNAAGITVFTISPSTGVLTVVPGSPFLPPTNTSEPSDVTVDATGRYVYAANGGTFGNGGVTGYSIEATTGVLTLAGGLLPGGTAPWDIATDSAGRYVYMTNNDGTIYGYTIDSATGILTNMALSPFSGTAPTRGVAVDPSGKFLYVANSTPQIQGYSVDPATGVLTTLSTSPYSAGNAPIDLTLVGTIH
jgi:6-phosphogluconolactonase (cycloisomerase 2 family)